MKLITWNVNSISVRLPRLLKLLERHAPDVVCLQETKVVEEKFPFAALHDAGYHAVVNGQAAYNGVATLSRDELVDVMHGFADLELDTQARLCCATTAGVRIINVYVPNGQSLDSDKYAYKLLWLTRLRSYLRDLQGFPAHWLLCGDLNMAPRAQDVAQPAVWEKTVLFHPQMRQEFTRLLELGLVDVVAHKHPDGGLYSWWDYRRLGFAKNNGLRIDHILASPPLAAVCRDVGVDRDERKGTQPSDHAPVIAEFAL